MFGNSEGLKMDYKIRNLLDPMIRGPARHARPQAYQHENLTQHPRFEHLDNSCPYQMADYYMAVAQARANVEARAKAQARAIKKYLARLELVARMNKMIEARKEAQVTALARQRARGRKQAKRFARDTRHGANYALRIPRAARQHRANDGPMRQVGVMSTEDLTRKRLSLWLEEKYERQVDEFERKKRKLPPRNQYIQPSLLEIRKILFPSPLIQAPFQIDESPDCKPPSTMATNGPSEGEGILHEGESNWHVPTSMFASDKDDAEALSSMEVNSHDHGTGNIMYAGLKEPEDDNDLGFDPNWADVEVNFNYQEMEPSHLPSRSRRGKESFANSVQAWTIYVDRRKINVDDDCVNKDDEYKKQEAVTAAEFHRDEAMVEFTARFAVECGLSGSASKASGKETPQEGVGN